MADVAKIHKALRKNDFESVYMLTLPYCERDEDLRSAFVYASVQLGKFDEVKRVATDVPSLSYELAYAHYRSGELDAAAAALSSVAESDAKAHLSAQIAYC
jgi:hypothetical protein